MLGEVAFSGIHAPQLNRFSRFVGALPAWWLPCATSAHRGYRCLRDSRPTSSIGIVMTKLPTARSTAKTKLESYQPRSPRRV